MKSEVKAEPEDEHEKQAASTSTGIVVVKQEQTVEEVDQLELDEIDESSCHSWSEPVQSKRVESSGPRISQSALS